MHGTVSTLDRDQLAGRRLLSRKRRVLAPTLLEDSLRPSGSFSVISVACARRPTGRPKYLREVVLIHHWLRDALTCAKVVKGWSVNVILESNEYCRLNKLTMRRRGKVQRQPVSAAGEA